MGKCYTRWCKKSCKARAAAGTGLRYPADLADEHPTELHSAARELADPSLPVSTPSAPRPEQVRRPIADPQVRPANCRDPQVRPIAEIRKCVRPIAEIRKCVRPIAEIRKSYGYRRMSLLLGGKADR